MAFDLVEWKRKRGQTLNVFVILCATQGLEYSMAMITLWLYINTLIPTDHPYLFYSLISGAYFAVGMIVPIFPVASSTRRVAPDRSSSWFACARFRAT